ncbi:hypothetical protein CEXT_317281 [Caerostris extrusa]|uniref:Uncharacterized protein n=1 Tax=Caerostris extrusa TaxID=172846 RepID=A0AAV4WVL7_CAEEX|nr:hypothetical protein CEXT_317281 [Caerostris extrusa]
MEDIKTSVLFTPMLQTRKEKASWILFFKCFQSASTINPRVQNNRAECYQKEKSNAHCRTTIDKTPAEKSRFIPPLLFYFWGAKEGGSGVNRESILWPQSIRPFAINTPSIHTKTGIGSERSARWT